MEHLKFQLYWWEIFIAEFVMVKDHCKLCLQVCHFATVKCDVYKEFVLSTFIICNTLWYMQTRCDIDIWWYTFIRFICHHYDSSIHVRVFLHLDTLYFVCGILHNQDAVIKLYFHIYGFACVSLLPCVCGSMYRDVLYTVVILQNHI